MAGDFDQSEQVRDQNRMSKKEARDFLQANLTNDTLSLLFSRSNSLGPAHTQGEGITQRHEYWEIRAHWESF